ncbi:MAG: UDP-3-O-acyl-N-acetylglucosamine deacetylase [Acidobacteriia bacterium]|jgi:UDP-3-O-[3-hydroxymyristoyl] N-acetylglucosamine deacetylase|nr:UDP-3-O-acyl-N-acetylglucosamine deacetylase [Terriglobia bacterium]HXF87327.1 UDP-3-O-acyl-N-acetylglucosamine deacetylase [Xanthobacteraceae bacterium]
MAYQTTIARPVETAGIGLHTAVPARLRLLPAPAGTGIVFRRTDLDDFQIEARAENVARVSYATSLMKRGVLISTTEHLLAALYASGVDNVIVELDAIEVPILDGSSQPFIELLARAGLRRQRRRRRYLQVLRPLEVAEDGRRICIYPAEEFSIRCFIEFPHPCIGAQQVELCVHRESFARELAPARTFGFLDDVERLRAMGLIRGGSLENAIVLTRDGLLNEGLRFPDEFVRHKALDLIGDLALLGWPLLGRVEAHKAGHALHVALVSRLLADRSLWKLTTAAESAGTARRVPRSRHAVPAAP